MFKRLFISISLLACAVANAETAATAGFTVTGTIRPSPCTLVLSGGGVADFGVLSSAAVKKWVLVAGPDRYVSKDAGINRSLPISVTCDAPTKVALHMTDNRAASMTGATSDALIRYGLGVYTKPGTPAANIGSYYIDQTNLKIKTAVGGTLASPAFHLSTAGIATTASVWTLSDNLGNMFLERDLSMAYTNVNTALTPIALVELSGNLVFYLETLKSVVDTATTDIILDGSTTLTLITL